MADATTQLEVRASKVTVVAVVILGIICVPLAAGAIYTGLSRGFRLAPVLIGAALLALLGVVFWLARRGHSRSVKLFTAKGLERNDGRSFPWTELSRVVDKMRIHPRSGRRVLWRTEVQFRGGESAWIIPSKVSNYAEVDTFVARLPCEHAEELA